MPRRHRHRLAALVAALVALAVLAGCGGDAPPADQGFGVNRDVRLADCDDWNNAGVDERMVTVRDIRNFAGGPIGNVEARGAILSLIHI